MKIEYKIEHKLGRIESHQQYLNKMGEEGWDLINFSKRDNFPLYITFVFKRVV